MRSKVCTTLWRKISEGIEPDVCQKSENFPNEYIKKCKDNTYEAINIPIQLKKT